MASDSVPMSNGFWSTPTTPIPVILPDPPPEARSSEPKQERKYHYKFDVDHNGLDINGFILHHDKHKGKRHKFRVYLDSNENGRFDKKDELIGRSALKQKHAAKGVGNLLDEGELGQLEVTFKKPKSNASMRIGDENYPTIRDTPLNQVKIEIDLQVGKLDPLEITSSAQSIGGGGGDGGAAGNVSVTNLSFSDSDGSRIAGFDAVMADGSVHSINDSISSSTIKALSSSGYSHLDDPEWQKMWQKYCTGDAKPPYPEDCFFGYPYS